jgi:Tol biopolymer transport system component
VDISVCDLASGTETVITHEGHDANATWSPDRSLIAYRNSAQPSQAYLRAR